MKIHPSAIIGKEVFLDEGVEVGPFSIIEGRVRIGKNTKVGARVTIKGNTTIGENCRIYEGAVLGEEPQHLRYEGEESEVIIGDNVIIREYVTVHRGTKLDKMKTVIGNDCMLMTYCHVAHDCILGRGVIMASYSGLSGHVEVGDYAFIGGLAGVHQWTRVGAFAMVGGMSGVTRDIPPFTLASGPHAELYGINVKGLERRGFTRERIEQIKRAYRILFKSGLLIREAIEKLRKHFEGNSDIEELISFIESSKRGIARDARG